MIVMCEILIIHTQLLGLLNHTENLYLVACSNFTMCCYNNDNITHECGLAVTSAYSVEEVSGSRPGCVILKTLRIVPTSTLFGAGHIGTALEYKLSLPSHVRISRAWFEKSIGLVALGCWSRKISLRRPSPGSW